MVKVSVHVYTLSKIGAVHAFNQVARRFGRGGLFHVAVEINEDGTEWSFGVLDRPEQRQPSVSFTWWFNRDNALFPSGVFNEPARGHPNHRYRDTLEMGESPLSLDDAYDVLGKLRSQNPTIFTPFCACMLV